MRANRIGLLAGLMMLWLLATGWAYAQIEPSPVQPYSVESAAQLVRPSVVAIETRFSEPLLEERYLFWQYMRGARPLYGLWGTGFIYKDPQYVITSDFLVEDPSNNHPVNPDNKGKAELIRVILDDGRSYQAELIGTDGDFDVAVLKVDWGPDLEPISPLFGNSDDLKLGQPIAVVGKSLQSMDTFATAGIISAIRKQVGHTEEPTDKFLQFDASYSLSFTGAPLIDIDGKVIGMVDRTVGDQINLGTPINDVISITDKIIAGEVTEIWFGVEAIRLRGGIVDQGWAPRTFDWNEDGTAEEVDFGYWISYIEPGSPADIAGLLAGDLIVELDDKFIKFDYDWDSYMRTVGVGQLLYVKFIRKNEITGKFERQMTQVQIQEKPDEEEQAETAATETRPGYLQSGMGY